jgi:hypothetical protein
MKNVTAAQRLAKEIDDQDKYYHVIVDGNNHPGVCNIVTTKELITVAKCKVICAKIEARFGIVVDSIKICMTQWDYRGMTANDYEYVLSGDRGVSVLGKTKEAIYSNKTNSLIIWENGLPVYENNNGVICKDADTLADCLC